MGHVEIGRLLSAVKDNISQDHEFGNEIADAVAQRDYVHIVELVGEVAEEAQLEFDERVRSMVAEKLVLERHRTRKVKAPATVSSLDKDAVRQAVSEVVLASVHANESYAGESKQSVQR